MLSYELWTHQYYTYPKKSSVSDLPILVFKEFHQYFCHSKNFCSRHQLSNRTLRKKQPKKDYLREWPLKELRRVRGLPLSTFTLSGMGV